MYVSKRSVKVNGLIVAMEVPFDDKQQQSVNATIYSTIGRKGTKTIISKCVEISPKFAKEIESIPNLLEKISQINLNRSIIQREMYGEPAYVDSVCLKPEESNTTEGDTYRKIVEQIETLDENQNIGMQYKLPEGIDFELFVNEILNAENNLQVNARDLNYAQKKLFKNIVKKACMMKKQQEEAEEKIYKGASAKPLIWGVIAIIALLAVVGTKDESAINLLNFTISNTEQFIGICSIISVVSGVICVSESWRQKIEIDKKLGDSYFQHSIAMGEFYKAAKIEFNNVKNAGFTERLSTLSRPAQVAAINCYIQACERNKQIPKKPKTESGARVLKIGSKPRGPQSRN